VLVERPLHTKTARDIAQAAEYSPGISDPFAYLFLFSLCSCMIRISTTILTYSIHHYRKFVKCHFLKVLAEGPGISSPTPPSRDEHSVELRGFEPLTPSVQRRCSPELSYSPIRHLNYSTDRGATAKQSKQQALVATSTRAYKSNQWAILDLNQRPLPYQRSALAS
jgi:hypothetical protein